MVSALAVLKWCSCSPWSLANNNVHRSLSSSGKSRNTHCEYFKDQEKEKITTAQEEAHHNLKCHHPPSSRQCNLEKTLPFLWSLSSRENMGHVRAWHVLPTQASCEVRFSIPLDLHRLVRFANDSQRARRVQIYPLWGHRGRSFVWTLPQKIHTSISRLSEEMIESYCEPLSTQSSHSFAPPKKDRIVIHPSLSRSYLYPVVGGFTSFA